MANVLSADRQLTIMRLLVKGASLRSITRIADVHRTAVQRWLLVFGDAAHDLLDDRMRGLTLRHIHALRGATLERPTSKGIT